MEVKLEGIFFVLDDYVHTNYSLGEALNFCCRHWKLTVILVVHGITKVGGICVWMM